MTGSAMEWGRWSMDFSGRPLIMGVINVTPDSFSDGGDFLSAKRAIDQGLQLVEQGADILDVGGESTRPGAAEVGEAEELDRVLPVIEALAANTSVPISIDTYKAEVAEAALEAGRP
jgi:dihydropteroate synthase